MAFLYSILPEYTRNSDILTDNNVKGKVKTLEEFVDIIDEEIFDVISDSVREILTFGSIHKISDEYLPYLGYLLGYKWNYNLDSTIQRNLLTNILELYKRKGTKFSFNFSLYNFKTGRACLFHWRIQEPENSRQTAFIICFQGDSPACK